LIGTGGTLNNPQRLAPLFPGRDIIAAALDPIAVVLLREPPAELPARAMISPTRFPKRAKSTCATSPLMANSADARSLASGTLGPLSCCFCFSATEHTKVFPPLLSIFLTPVHPSGSGRNCPRRHPIVPPQRPEAPWSEPLQNRKLLRGRALPSNAGHRTQAGARRCRSGALGVDQLAQHPPRLQLCG